MRTPLKPCLLLACAIALVIGLAAPAAAHTGSAQSVTLAVSDMITLPIDNWQGYTFTLASGDSIAYGIQTVGLDPIDVYFVSSSGLTAYENHQTFQTLSAIENKTQIAGEFSSGTGSITLIIDNTNLRGAIPTGSVQVQVGLSKVAGSGGTGLGFLGIDFALIGAIIGGIIVLVVVLIVVAVVLSHRKRAPAAPPQQQPYGQPYQQSYPPYQQPPQGGTPPQGPYPPGP